MGMLVFAIVVSFGTGVWWFGVATKPWVDDQIGDAINGEAKERKGNTEKLETIRIDVGVVKSKVESLERANERTTEAIQQLYHDLGAIPSVKRARRREQLEASR